MRVPPRHDPLLQPRKEQYLHRPEKCRYARINENKDCILRSVLRCTKLRTEAMVCAGCQGVFTPALMFCSCSSSTFSTRSGVFPPLEHTSVHTRGIFLTSFSRSRKIVDRIGRERSNKAPRACPVTLGTTSQDSVQQPVAYTTVQVCSHTAVTEPESDLPPRKHSGEMNTTLDPPQSCAKITKKRCFGTGLKLFSFPRATAIPYPRSRS